MRKTVYSFLSLLLCFVMTFGAFPVSAQTEISSVSVTVTAPVAGANPVFQATAGDSSYTVENVRWLHSGVELSAGDSFASGNTYWVEVTLTAEEETAFAQSVSGTVNGRSATCTLANGTVVLEASFTLEEIIDTPQTEIPSVAVAGVTPPEENQKPDFTADVAENALYTVEQVMWRGWKTSDGANQYQTLSENDIFLQGYTYQVAVLLKAKQGAVFQTDGNGNPNVSATVNGATAYPGTAVTGKEPSQYIMTGYDFVLQPEKEQINKVEITDVTLPSIGKKPVLTVQVPEDALYTVDKVVWKYWVTNVQDPIPMTSRDTYEAGKAYQLFVILKAKENAEFTVSQFDQPMVGVTVNGNPADSPIIVDGQKPAEYICVSYNFQTAQELIEEVSIWALDEPEKGKLPDFKLETSAFSLYEIEEVNWQWRDPQTPNAQFSSMTHSGVFENDKEYRVCVTLVATENTEFATTATGEPKVKVKFNGEDGGNSQSVKDREANTCIQVTYDFLLESDVKIVERVMVEELEMPVAGNLPDVTATVSFVAKYTVKEVVWEQLKDGSYEKQVDAFRAGEHYRVTVLVQAKEDAEFAVSDTGRIQVQGMIDDETVSVSKASDRDPKKYLVLTRQFSIYTVIEGDHGLWTPAKKNLRFRFSGETEKFVDIQVDGVQVKERFYTVSEGPLVIELDSQYLSVLADGKHQLTVNYTDGIATTEFEISQDGSVVTSQENKSNTSWVWYLVIPLLIVLLVGAIALSVFLRKKGWL